MSLEWAAAITRSSCTDSRRSVLNSEKTVSSSSGFTVFARSQSARMRCSTEDSISRDYQKPQFNWIHDIPYVMFQVCVLPEFLTTIPAVPTQTVHGAGNVARRSAHPLFNIACPEALLDGSGLGCRVPVASPFGCVVPAFMPGAPKGRWASGPFRNASSWIALAANVLAAKPTQLVLTGVLL